MCYYAITIVVAYAFLVDQRLRTTASCTTPAHDFPEQRESVEMKGNQQQCRCRAEREFGPTSFPAASCCRVKNCSNRNDSINSSETYHSNSSSAVTLQCIQSLLLELYKEQQLEIGRLKKQLTGELRRETMTSEELEGLTVQELQAKVDVLHRELEEKEKEIDKLVRELHTSYLCFSSVMNTAAWTVWNGAALLLMSYWQVVLLCTCCGCCCCSYCVEQFGWVARK